MKKRIGKFTLYLLSLAYTCQVVAYDPESHKQMSELAAGKSVVFTTPDTLKNLGLDATYLSMQLLTNSNSKKRTVPELFRDGAEFEDNNTRPLHHFFNPMTGLGILGFSASPDWAIEGIGDASTIKFSYNAAREFLWQAVANPLNSYDYRQKQFGLMFETLGRVTHHLQDMAQPQHVRDDLHCDVFPCYLVGMHHPSAYEKYTKPIKINDALLAGFPVYAPVYGEADRLAFNSPRKFWATGTTPGLDSVSNGKGIAEFTSRNFVSADTNFDKPNATLYPLPAYDPLNKQVKTAAVLCQELGTVECAKSPGLSQYPNATLTFYGTQITDTFRPETNAANPRASSESAFDEFLLAAGKPPTFTLNRFNFDAAHQFLIPRAVSYSAGLINYFFRGKMQISLPDEGVYGLVDHADSKFTNLNPLTNFTGFNKIKLKLGNLTPNNEAMSGGLLRAVLKFRRNSCYTDDLSGYPPFVSWDTCRTMEEEIIVSDPANGGANVALTSAPQPFTFNFSQALPINATDVRLQVVYRGTLGEELDAVVVATQDIAEPTFFTYHNARDYIRLGTLVYTRAEVNANASLINQIRPFSCVDYTLSPPQLQSFCFNPDTLSKTFTLGSTTTIQINALQVQRFMRIAFLGEATPPNAAPPTLLAQAQTETACLPLTPFSFPPVQWQTTYDPAPNTTYPAFYKIRGVTSSYGASCLYFGDGGAPGTPDNRDTKMSNVGNQVPVPVLINNGGGF